MNDIIWPDFSRLPTEESPVIRYRSLPEGVAVRTDGISITPWFLFNNNSDFGYLLDDGTSSLLYTSDIGHDAELCKNGKVPDSMIIEVSFPNENEELALRTGHLTPLLMLNLLKKLPRFPGNIFVAHLKTYYREKIVAEIKALGLSNLKVLHDGDVLEL
jgi:ribonuclease BN (tRNA processing enzyme)